MSVYYYLRVVYYLYMREPAEGYATQTTGGIFATGALAIAMIGIFVIGIFPTPLFAMAGAAARALLP